MSTIEPHEETLFGHPKGLYTLFFTEMWERFSYYGMRALLVLYMSSTTAGALGWSKAEAIGVYGTYTMMVYVCGIPGGIIADRLLGQKKSVMLGGAFLVAGHGIMAVPQLWAFYTALVLIVIGVGLLKPNISTMVGGLYKPGDPRRDQGFAIFYMGINIGALASALIVGFVGETYGWHYGFGLAGIGMLFGQIQFMYGQRYLTHVGNRVKDTGKEGAVDHSVKLTKVEKDRVLVLLVSFLIVVVFWGAFEQAGGLMSIFTNEKVDRTLGGFLIPASVFQSLNPAFIILFATVVAGFWHKRQLAGKQASAIFKMAVGTMIMGLGFIFMVFSAREGAPQEELGVMAKETVEAAGSPSEDSTFWMVADAARKVAEESAATAGSDDEAITLAGDNAVSAAADVEADRIMVSAVEGADATLLRAAIHGGLVSMAAAEDAIEAGDEVARAEAVTGVAEASYRSAVHASTAMFWLVLAYLFHTIGELCSSPVALSFITKLSPAKYASLMMGVYFAVTGIGNKLAAVVGSRVENFSEFSIFLGITVFTVIFSGCLLVFLKPLNRLTHGAEDIGAAE
ncbi:MAG: POT family proton-dependent oligopeptide transporter [Planctomycetota bacterium]|jgi:POT family proton-dependent oligopeptide transporter